MKPFKSAFLAKKLDAWQLTYVCAHVPLSPSHFHTHSRLTYFSYHLPPPLSPLQVREMVQKLVPGAQVLPVGSYRRGKQSSGDCDVLIAPPEGKHTINILWDLLQAMTHTGFLTDHLIGHDDEAHARSAQCTYMGVCKELGRNDAIFRRIDIKVYPRAALPFALLYFTGLAI